MIMRDVKIFCTFILSLEIYFKLGSCLPTVDPGVFVLQGVLTCRGGKGYCVLGRSCTVDKDFIRDDQGGNCNGVTNSFTSKLTFSCCKYVNDTSSDEEEYVTTLSPITALPEKFMVMDENPVPIFDFENTEPPPTSDFENIIKVVGAITDTTGIIDIITEPYLPVTTPRTTANKTPATSLSPFYSDNDTMSTTTQAPTTVSSINQTMEKQENKEETPTNENGLETINLPFEIWQFLNKNKDATKSYKTTEISSVFTNIPTDILDNENNQTIDKDKVSITSPKSSFISSPDENIEPMDGEDNLISEFLIKATTYATNEMTKDEKPSHLKGNPLVPLHYPDTTTLVYDETTTDAYPTTVTDFEELDNSTNSPRLKSTLLQRMDTSNILAQENENGNTIDEVLLPHPININVCGLRRDNLQVSKHGQQASTYDWCWSAALMSKRRGGNKFECSGTLVEVDLVITTAACLKRLQRQDLSSYRIVLGDSNLRDEVPYGVQFRDIAEIFTHPDYMTSGGAHVNDIGLIRLKGPAALGHNVCLACISQANADIPGDSCVVSGYMTGNIPREIRKDVEGFAPVEGILRESPVVLENPSNCQSLIRRMVSNPLLTTNPEAFLCDVKDEPIRSCISTLDGGSPLVCKAGGKWFLTGIASWSKDCVSEPKVYTRVNAFSNWFINMRLRINGFILSHLL